MMPGMMNEKKLAAIIVGGLPEEKKVDKEPMDMVGLDAAADDIMKAFESKDKKMLKESLKSFFYLMEAEEEMMEEQTESEE